MNFLIDRLVYPYVVAWHFLSGEKMNALKYKSLLAILALLLSIGAPALAGPLKDFNGKDKSISDYAGDGKWRIVMIWASDCHVCNQEAHAYLRFHRERRDKDARLLGISMDGREKLKEAREFIKRHHLDFPNLIGEPEDVAVEYMKLTGADWVGTPTFLIYTPAGKLVAKQEGAVPVSLIEQFIASSTPKEK